MLSRFRNLSRNFRKIYIFTKLLLQSVYFLNVAEADGLKYSVGTTVTLNVAVFCHIEPRRRSTGPVSQKCNSVFVLVRYGKFEDV